MQWLDYTATTRVRMFPVEEFARIARKERRVGISQAACCMLHDDTVLSRGSTTGQFYLEPDLNSLYRNGGLPSTTAPSASVMTFWRSEEGLTFEGCPRSTLQSIADNIHTEHKIQLQFGFEIEVVFMKAIRDQNTGHITEYSPATTIHSWSQMTSETRQLVPLLEEITRTLASMGIKLQQFHAESAPGQFEFVLPPDTPLAAVDSLIAARQVITAVAEQHGLRATLYPCPIPGEAGSAAHAHISINPPTLEDAFLAGILDYFPSITAFTLSSEASYERVRSGIWAGSEWVAWGFQNREAPVRKIGPGHWEFKSLDGSANMYLAMAALLAAGKIGLDANLDLRVKECTVDAATLSHFQRVDLGITTMIPKSLEESLDHLEASSSNTLKDLLGTELVKNYVTVKRAEIVRLREIPEETRRLWLLERY
ncbi:uncharacterized protein N7477_006878 [Penicillium maclennaniae]|uniref:uncharacterized protein n=1 Tax=Penicillium maclennaniae TaxID=1343394 RepID=UPI0025417BA2|nr:uncharacterized protein N7477_006878 [Penicillium maclennaniae]KAJ5668308.1 hypothetical protein N7477_006878 [Penicillium maclennaniae]